MENDKKEIKKENEKIKKEIKIYKDTISKFRYHSNDINYDTINKKDKNDKNEHSINNTPNKNEKIKIIFLLKNKKNIDEEKMFIEVKLRLLNVRHLGPRDIKSCLYNSKEINDWFTLEELNIDNNDYILCEIA